MVALAVLWPRLTTAQIGIYKAGLSTESDSAVTRAQKLFKEAKSVNEDFSKGFCLSNDLLPGWVASVNGSAAALCQALMEGRAEHFVELDLNGIVIRVK